MVDGMIAWCKPYSTWLSQTWLFEKNQFSQKCFIWTYRRTDGQTNLERCKNASSNPPLTFMGSITSIFFLLKRDPGIDGLTDRPTNRSFHKVDKQRIATIAEHYISKQSCFYTWCYCSCCVYYHNIDFCNRYHSCFVFRRGDLLFLGLRNPCRANVGRHLHFPRWRLDHEIH